MTDIIPNDLSHISDEDFNALCPQGEHAPGPEPLSPAAQAVWDAAWQFSPVNCKSHEDRRRQQIAAALRAAASQLTSTKAMLQLQAIAAELDSFS